MKKQHPATPLSPKLISPAERGRRGRYIARQIKAAYGCRDVGIVMTPAKAKQKGVELPDHVVKFAMWMGDNNPPVYLPISRNVIFHAEHDFEEIIVQTAGKMLRAQGYNVTLAQADGDKSA